MEGGGLKEQGDIDTWNGGCLGDGSDGAEGGTEHLEIWREREREWELFAFLTAHNPGRQAFVFSLLCLRGNEAQRYQVTIPGTSDIKPQFFSLYLQLKFWL
jgi:hypothetical protein